MWWDLIKFAPATAAFGSVYGFFAVLGSLISAEAKASISAWIERVDIPASRAWPSQFIHLFDTVFGERHLSFKCLLRSFIASIVVTGFIVFVWIARGEPVSVYPLNDFFATKYLNYLFLPFFGLLPDYVSLLKSRYSLYLMEIYNNFFARLAILMADVALVFAIWIVSLCAILLLYFGPTLLSPPGLYAFPRTLYIWGDNQISAAMHMRNDLFHGMFYAGFFTSFWALLYLLSAFVCRLLALSHTTLRGLVWFFDIKNKPLQCIGYVAGIFCAAITYVFTVFL
jgi:hypothetical protein